VLIWCPNIGNTLISYYLGDILEHIGYTDPLFKSKLNTGLTAWNLVNATCYALIVKRFARRKMYLTCTISLLCCYIGWTISMRYAYLPEGVDPTAASVAAGKVVIFFIFVYALCYNIGYNALTYTYLVELFPYTIRSRGITVFQFWGRGAACFRSVYPHYSHIFRSRLKTDFAHTAPLSTPLALVGHIGSTSSATLSSWASKSSVCGSCGPKQRAGLWRSWHSVR
jgi:hypothetical protein